MNCLECKEPAEWVRATQFAGDHPYCDKHARLEEDFGQEDSSYFFWYTTEDNEAREFLQRAEAFDPSNREAFASLLTDARRLTRLTLQDFAQMFHTGAGTVSRWEHGYSAPPEVARKAIVEQLRKLVSETKSE